MARTDQEEQEQDARTYGPAAWTTAAVLAAAVLGYVVVRRFMQGKPLLDIESLLDACSRAADNLDRILLSEKPQIAS
ncbi:MAG: hypothetical protein IIC73_02000 [Armatimonadetes bacterium]|nr:hypothetical protein [Armatimonadota bacterium]